MVKSNGLQIQPLLIYSSSMQKWMVSIFQPLLLNGSILVFRQDAEEKKMGIKGSSTRTLIFEDALVPKENLLGELGKGHIIAFNILNIGRYKLAAGTIGGAKRIIDVSVQYANQRQQFHTPIAKFSLIGKSLRIWQQKHLQWKVQCTEQ